jgi:hypothetical protein
MAKNFPTGGILKSRIARFFIGNYIPNDNKIKQITYTKWPQKVTNGQKIDQKLHSKLLIIYQSWYFGMKLYHLATLIRRVGWVDNFRKTGSNLAIKKVCSVKPIA